MRKTKNKFFIMLLVVLFFVGVGYALLFSKFNIVGTASISSQKWSVKFSNINMIDGSYDVVEPATITGDTQVSFRVRMNQPGDYYKFVIDVCNYGTIDAKLSTFSVSDVADDFKDFLSFEVKYKDGSELKSDDVLKAGEKVTLFVQILYDMNIEEDDLPSTSGSARLTFNCTYEQVDSIVDSSKVVSAQKDVYNVFVGDSRTVGMCVIKTEATPEACQFSGTSGRGYRYENDIYIGQVSQGYSWYLSTAKAALESVVSEKSDAQYNVIINLGVNDLSNYSNYVKAYNELASSKPDNVKLIFLSVNPVNQSLASTTFGNTDIEKFNSKMKKNLSKKFTYCDSYTVIKDTFESSDGLHYTGNTYNDIYNKALNCAINVAN